MTNSIFSYTAAAYAEWIVSQLGRGEILAKALYKSWMREAAVPTRVHPLFRNAGKLLSAMVEITDFSTPQIRAVLDTGSTKKVVLQGEFEMVLLPMKAGTTLCISSQVGCKMGCAFCETGKMGLIRSLSASEIVSQLFIALHQFQQPVRNIVFMGMGEPFDNYEEVMQAVRIFTDMQGFALGASHITISTSGLVDKIYRFAKEAPPSLNLALSVNASNEKQRNSLMPVNQRFSMEELLKAIHVYLEHPRRKILIEYVLIEGKNDSLADAAALVEYFKGVDKKRLTLNLIPYNAQRKGIFKAPESEVVEAFSQFLQSHQFFSYVRDTKGDKIMAACGQLGNRQIKKSPK